MLSTFEQYEKELDIYKNLPIDVRVKIFSNNSYLFSYYNKCNTNKDQDYEVLERTYDEMKQKQTRFFFILNHRFLFFY
jgi:hypothetical protein